MFTSIGKSIFLVKKGCNTGESDLAVIPYKLPRTFLIFCSIGAFNTLVNYGVFLFSLHYVGLQFSIAGMIGFLSGAITGFILNRKLTFNSSISIFDQKCPGIWSGGVSKLNYMPVCALLVSLCEPSIFLGIIV